MKFKVRYFVKRGIYHLDFHDASGKRQRPSTGCKTLEAAEAATAEVIAKTMTNDSTSATIPASREVLVPKLAGMTLRQAFKKANRERDSWVKSKDKESKETDFRGLTGTNPKLTEDMDCSVMTRALMQTLKAFWMEQPGLRKGTKLSNSTINHRLSMASVILEMADCPPHTVKHLTVKNNGRKRRVRDEELQAVVSWCINNFDRKGALTMADLILMGRMTTARISDLLTLKWADIYLEMQKVIYRDPKNGKTHEGHLTAGAIQILERRKALANEGPFTDLGYAQAHALWRSARKAMGLADDHEFVFHVVTRHEGLSRLGETGASSFQLMAYSGHESIVAAARYVKVKTETLGHMGAALDVGLVATAAPAQPTDGTIPDAGRMH